MSRKNRESAGKPTGRKSRSTVADPKTKTAAPADPRSSQGEGRQQSFLARWSRRKRQVRDAQARTPPAAGEPAARRAAPEVSRRLDKTDADLPPLDALDEHSDYSAFLSPKVSEGLRKAALRKLFHLPQFNVVDGLDDYAEDYTGFTPLGDILTADMRHRLEVEKERARERLQALAHSGQGGDKDEAVPVASAATDAKPSEPPPDVGAPQGDEDERLKSAESSESGADDKPPAA